MWSLKKFVIMGQLKARNYLHFCDKYEQTVNIPKITFKKAFFRIFWKILAKTGPQSLYLCGFPEARVEMEVAPFRALTLLKPYLKLYS